MSPQYTYEEAFSMIGKEGSPYATAGEFYSALQQKEAFFEEVGNVEALQQEREYIAETIRRAPEVTPEIIQPVVDSGVTQLTTTNGRGTLATNGINGYTNGYSSLGNAGLYDDGGGGVTYLGGPTVAVGGALILRTFPVVTLALFKWAVQRFGANAVKLALGAVLFDQLMDMWNAGAPDTASVRNRRRKKRYSIGANPRLNTLLKVAKRVDNIFISYDRRMSKFRSRIRGTGRTRTRYVPAPTAYLSPVERRALSRNRR